jgi:PKD repeat protein
LTVTDDDDDFSSVTRRVTVLNRRPVASFDLDDEEVWKGRRATLNASSTSDPDGRIAQYEWDFGDGTEGEVTRTPSVHHVFETAGEVTVTLTVVDDMGASAQVERVVTVLNRVPEATLGIDPGTVLTGEEVTLDGSRSFDPDGVVVDLEFTVLDGAGEVVGLFAGTLDEHPWFPEDDGGYTVVLNVTDDDGAWARVEGEVTVLNRPPEVVLDEATGDIFGSVLEAPSTLVAGVLAEDDDGEVTSITWVGGEPPAQVAEGASVTIPLDAEAALSLLVTVVDDDGARSTTWLNLTVNEPPVARLAVTLEGEDLVDHKVREGRMMTFDGSNSSDPGGIARFQWDFGDGFTQEGALVSHAYRSAGPYTVTLKVTDDHGATDQVTYEVTVVEEPAPEVSGISGTTLALVAALVVAVVTVTAYVLWRRGQGERDGGMRL